MASILWLTENYPPQRGGMAQSCERIVNGLSNKGLTIDIVHFTSTNKPFSREIKLYGTYMAVPFEESEAHTLNLTWCKIKNYENISFIVCYGGYLSLIAAPVFSKWLNLKLFTLLRGNDFDTSIFTPRKRTILDDAIRQSKVVACVSSSKQQKLESLYTDKKIVYIPNSIDSFNWQASPSEIKFAEHWRHNNLDNKICIGIFGDIKPKKGIDFLINSLVKTKIINKLHFLLIGEINEKIKEFIVNQQINHSCFPFMDRYELMKYYFCCDAIAIPSFYDGMPNVLLEAGALGIPVIASDVDGMHDVISHNISGLLFNSGDEDDCRNTFYTFLGKNTNDRKALGLNLKYTILDKYNVDNEINRYIELFN